MILTLCFQHDRCEKSKYRSIPGGLICSSRNLILSSNLYPSVDLNHVNTSEVDLLDMETVISCLGTV
jgi:hypothetical protein